MFLHKSKSLGGRDNNLLPKSSMNSKANSINSALFESFMNKYVDFMKKYKQNPTDQSMLSEYSTIMSEYTKFSESLSKVDTTTLSAEDLAYYFEVVNRVNAKIAELN